MNIQYYIENKTLNVFKIRKCNNKKNFNMSDMNPEIKSQSRINKVDEGRNIH